MLLKGPENKDSFASDLIFTKSARAAWGQLLDRLTAAKQRPLRLLLPAYIGQNDREGSGVFDPIRAIESGFEFYPMDAQLTPNVPAIEKIVAAGGIDVLLIIHYFGFVRVRLRDLKDLCAKHDVTLVEDCAHCPLLHNSAHGLTGDYSFYSLHKFFPTGTGGALRSNGEGASDPEDPHDAAPCDPGVLAQLLRTDIPGVNRKRRKNYLWLENALTGVAGIAPLWSLDAQTVPHNFPVRIADGRREKLYFHLQEQGLVTIALYYRLVDEIERDRFAISFEISDSILNLPVHQDTDVRDLEPLVAKIGSFLNP